MKGRVFTKREPGERSWRFGWAEEVFIHGVDGGGGGPFLGVVKISSSQSLLRDV